jgi:hypothetical protein
MRIVLITGIALALLGCASEEARSIDRTDFDIPACEPGDPQLLDSLTLAEPVDYLEMRSDWGAEAVRGTRCSGATDPTACEQAFAELDAPPDAWPARTGGGAPAPLSDLAFTRGDEVGAVGRSGLPALLAPIGVADAAFLAQAATQGNVACAEPLVRDVPGGYEVIVRKTFTCGGGVQELLVFVDADGATTLVETVTVSEGSEEICP